MKRLLAVLLCVGAPAFAEGRDPMTAEEFRAMAQGYTLHFRDRFGTYFGSEQYFENGETLWLPRGGACQRGVWAEDGERICFLYQVGLSCWRLYPEGESGIYAESADEGRKAPETRLWLTRRDKTPIDCDPGPGV